jgi:excisionase family DNA binding protein
MRAHAAKRRPKTKRRAKIQRLTMTRNECAKALGVSKETLDQYHLEGRVGPRRFKKGRTVRYERDEVLRWISAGRPDARTWRKW